VEKIPCVSAGSNSPTFPYLAHKKSMQHLKPLALFIAFLALFSCESGTQTTTQVVKKAAKTYSAFVGTYTRKEGHVNGKGEGIYLYQLDSASGYLDKIGVQKEIVNPSFLTPSADGQYLYAVEEIGAAVDKAGRVVAYRQAGDHLEKINQQSTFAFAPCYVSTDSKGRYVFVANYAGAIAVYPIAENGGLGEAIYKEAFQGKGPHSRQDAPHPHSVNLSPDDRFLYVPDLGTDNIYIYSINYEDAKKPLNRVGATKIQAAGGPRHFTFHPTLNKAYVVNELSCKVTEMNWDKTTGMLDTVASISTLPAGYKESNTCSDLHITPNGQFLYAANRGHNSIVGFSIAANGKLSLIGHASTQGEVPRNFAISPDGRFLYAANQNSDNILILSVGADGKLNFKKEEKVFTPVCVRFRQ
jgi:6-phosphogluconolactonase